MQNGRAVLHTAMVWTKKLFKQNNSDMLIAGPIGPMRCECKARSDETRPVTEQQMISINENKMRDLFEWI